VKRPWTQEEQEIIIRFYPTEGSLVQARLKGRGKSAIQKQAQHLGVSFVGPEEGEDNKEPTVKDQLIKARSAAEQPPNDYLISEIAKLQKELAQLRAQKTWSDHANPETTTGGKVTIWRADDHIADANHLLTCCAQMEEKTCALLALYEPDEIQIAHGGDMIAGHGIYKNQDLDSVTSNVLEQAQVAAMKMRAWLMHIRTVSEAPILWRQLQGNHEVGGGQGITEFLFDTLRAVCSDVPDVKFTYSGARMLLNLAHKGTYNALMLHGFGHSNQSPQSASFISATKDMLLTIANNMEIPKEQQPRRVVSGHTHWTDVDLERTIGISYDSAGGLQRNTRVKLGMNQRRPGWVVYVSPKGSSEILKPVQIVPDDETLAMDIENAYLVTLNRKDAANYLEEYKKLRESRGDYEDGSVGGLVRDGRW